MTYCVAISLNEGIILASDSRTNAGIDLVSTYSKLYTFGVDGNRQFALLSAGNLGTTQAVVTQITRDIKSNAEKNLYNVHHLSDAAEYLGIVSRQQQEKYSLPADSASNFNPESTFILGGQIGHESHGVYMIYPQGNFITVSMQTRYLQIGESKYGKPILDRIIKPNTSLEDAARCALVSMDSTMHSNVSVGPPIEILAYRKDALKFEEYLYFDADEPYLLGLRRAWDDNIKQAFSKLPGLQWGSFDKKLLGG